MLEFAAGESIFEEGDLGTEMYIIQTGSVGVFKRVRDEERRLAVLEKGDFFGEMAILESLPRSAAARAIDDVCIVEINSSIFGQMLNDNPEIAIRMMRKLSRRLRRAGEALRKEAGLDLLELEQRPEPPAPKRPTAAQFLESGDSDVRLYLAGDRETTIGRKDPVTGIDPEIDLTPVDPQRSTSRRHAVIHRRGGKFFLTEEVGTTNGTFVGETRLQTSAPLEIEDGDALRFGLVELTFRT